MFATLRSRWHRRKAVNAGDAVYTRAAQQISRMAEQGSFGTTDNLLLNGEAELLSLTSMAASATEDGYSGKLDSLADKRSGLVENLATAQTELEQAATRSHVVSESKRIKEAGRAMTVPEMVECVEELTAQIDDETAAGATRHRHHVSRFWRGAAVGLLAIDVAALFVLMMTIENTSFAKFTRRPGEQLAPMITALGFSLLAAAVLAIAAHTLGQAIYRRIHRRGEGENRPQLIADNLGALGAAAAIVTTIAVVVGFSMHKRIAVAADGTNAAQLSGTVGLAIAMCATVAPLIVAWITAMEASPEVTFRDSLSRQLTQQGRGNEKLAKQIIALQLQIAAVDEKTERTLSDAERALQEAMLPATQLILRLRTDFGHAGEVYAPLILPALTQRPAAIAWAGLQRLRLAYRPEVPATEESTGPHAIEQAA